MDTARDDLKRVAIAAKWWIVCNTHRMRKETHFPGNKLSRISITPPTLLFLHIESKKCEFKKDCIIGVKKAFLFVLTVLTELEDRIGSCYLNYCRIKSSESYLVLKERLEDQQVRNDEDRFFFDQLYRLKRSLLAIDSLQSNILERKNPFLGFKNKNFKKSKNLHFS